LGSTPWHKQLQSVSGEAHAAGLGNAVSTTTPLNNSFGTAVTVTGVGFLLNPGAGKA
jgi:hypothetical protein